MRQIHEVLCSKKPNTNDIEAIGKDISSLIGSGGGGATALFVNDRLKMIAGGGGGGFFEAFNTAQHIIRYAF